MRLALLHVLASGLMLAGCDPLPEPPDARPDSKVESSEFPEVRRPVAPITSNRWSTEEARDKVDEAQTVMDLAGITPGMTVADIGAGEGYYTIRLAERVGRSGRVLAQDIDPKAIAALAARVTREAHDSVSVIRATPENPSLPANSFDRIFLVRMFHEVSAPYEFLWRLRPALRIGGRVIIVDGDKPVVEHGMPVALLDCEMRATGFRRVELQQMPQLKGYVAAYEASGKRPEPDAIETCRESGEKD